jgi:hypothetical protein
MDQNMTPSVTHAIGVAPDRPSGNPRTLIALRHKMM